MFTMTLTPNRWSPGMFIAKLVYERQVCKREDKLVPVRKIYRNGVCVSSTVVPWEELHRGHNFDWTQCYQEGKTNRNAGRNVVDAKTGISVYIPATAKGDWLRVHNTLAAQRSAPTSLQSAATPVLAIGALPSPKKRQRIPVVDVQDEAEKARKRREALDRKNEKARAKRAAKKQHARGISAD